MDAWLLIKNKAQENKYDKKHLFWALYFMNNYTSEDSLAGTFNTTSKTFCEKMRGILKLLATECGVKVRIRNVKVSASCLLLHDVSNFILEMEKQIN